MKEKDERTNERTSERTNERNETNCLEEKRDTLQNDLKRHSYFDRHFQGRNI